MLRSSAASVRLAERDEDGLVVYHDGLGVEDAGGTGWV